MNKRLEELALECGAWHQVYEPKRFLHDHNFDIERFAELIVKECALLCSDPVVVLQHWGLDSESE
jgi:hypothetical protein